MRKTYKRTQGFPTLKLTAVPLKRTNPKSLNSTLAEPEPNTAHGKPWKYANVRISIFGLRVFKKTPPVPCVTVPLNLLETGGTRPVAFDFQSRPVGHNHDSDPVSYLLRFKDIVSNHEHRQGKLSILKIVFLLCVFQRTGALLPLRASQKILLATASEFSRKKSFLF